jgi:uncharacterized protein with FMN-binding domain
MKDRNFMIKCINLLLVLLVLAGYQTVVHVRAQDAEIAQLKAEVSAYQKAAEEASAAAEAESENAIWKDGTYTGSAAGFGGTITVEVTVENGSITSVDVLEAAGEDSAYLQTAMALTDQIVEQQSTELDAVSGATFSSNGILGAAEAALDEAVNK